jgi:FAD/FMN-containing dehydrogenase
MAGFSRRALLFGAGAATGAVGAKLAIGKAPVLDGITPIAPAGGDGVLNDASLLSETPVYSHVTLSQDPGDALVTAIRAGLREAAAEGRPFNIGAARHSMGGQAIPRDGRAITFDSAFVEPDTQAQTYRAHAGTRWASVIAALDPHGLSPAVMQSNNDFGIAATYSVNAHGWPVPYGPMGATVRSVTMVLADGELVTASRTTNTALFNAAMGGYGLVGAITEMEVDAVPNLRLEPRFETMPAEDLSSRFRAVVDDPEVNMAYGRLNVDRENFFREALLVSYRPSADQSDLPPASGSGTMAHLASYIYRAQLGREAIKRVRWGFETGLAPRLAAGPVTRNSLINEPVATLDDRDPTRTDILHEYFVGFDRFGDFLAACREVIPASYQEFLNVTLRFVDTDAESLLSYAPVPRIAAVMSFSQEMTDRAEADMERMTRDLVDRVTEIGGTYYLPYRPHPTRAQFRAAYPGHAAFVRLKREVDPGLTFRNALWDRYMA